jgi:hypothetical protein
MKIHSIYCLSCKDLIYSRTRHDMRNCTCGSVAIDGGFDYYKVSYKEKTDFCHVTIDIDVTKDQLFDDWNLNLNKFGVVKTVESVVTKKLKNKKNKQI